MPQKILLPVQHQVRVPREVETTALSKEPWGMKLLFPLSCPSSSRKSVAGICLIYHSSTWPCIASVSSRDHTTLPPTPFPKLLILK